MSSGSRRLLRSPLLDAQIFAERTRAPRDADCKYNPAKARPGQAWIVVRAGSLTRDSIMAALARGDFYASTGVALDDYASTEREIAIAFRSSGRAAIIDSAGRRAWTQPLFLDDTRRRPTLNPPCQ